MLYLQGGVHKANNIGIEGPIDWIKDSQFSKSLNSAEKHRPDNDVAEDLDIHVSPKTCRTK